MYLVYPFNTPEAAVVSSSVQWVSHGDIISLGFRIGPVHIRP